MQLLQYHGPPLYCTPDMIANYVSQIRDADAEAERKGDDATDGEGAREAITTSAVSGGFELVDIEDFFYSGFVADVYV